MSGTWQGIRVVAVLAMLAAAGLTGCTADQDSAAADTDDKKGRESVRPSPPSPSPLVPSVPPSATEWPDRATTGHEAPSTGRVGPIAKGYSGKDFLKRFARTWGIKLSRPKLVDVAGGKKAWSTGGSLHRDGVERFAVAATSSRSGDLETLSCRVYRKVPDREAFLTGCARLDHPQADTAKTAEWLSTAEKQVADLYADKKVPCVSQIHVSGGAAMLLWKSPSSHAREEQPDYWLRIFGGGIAEHS